MNHDTLPAITKCHRCGDKAPPTFAHTDADNNALQLYLVGNSAVIRLHKATGEGATIALSAKKLDALRGALGIIDAAEVIATLDAEYAEQERDERVGHFAAGGRHAVQAVAKELGITLEKKS